MGSSMLILKSARISCFDAEAADVDERLRYAYLFYIGVPKSAYSLRNVLSSELDNSGHMGNK